MTQTIDPSGSQPLPATSNNALPPGTVVGDYTIQGLVGEGGFGIVYRAFDNVMQREIALKEYMPNALARRRTDGQVELRAPQYEATFHAGRRSFVNEARLLAQFDHKALVKVYRFLEANGTAYMVMPLYEGRTLKQILRESPAIDEAWLKSLIAPLLDALETLHGARCFHRDVAPDNILILESGGPLLLDFGAARRIIGDMTQAVTVVIKPGYAPVEQYADDNSLQQGPWTDIYALAAVVRLAITGKPPATSVTRMVSDPVKPLSEIATGYSPQFLRAIDFGLAVRPEDRPQSIAEFREALGLSGAPVRAVTPPPSAATTSIPPAAVAPSPKASPAPAPIPPPASAGSSPPAASPAAPARPASPPPAAPIAPALKPVPPPLKPDATGPIGETVPMRQHRTMPPAPVASAAIPTEAKAAPAHPSIPVKPPPMAPAPPIMARPAPAQVATPRRQWVPIAVVVAMMLVVVVAGYFVMQAVTSSPARDSVARSPAAAGGTVTPSPAPAPAAEPKSAPPAAPPADRATPAANVPAAATAPDAAQAPPPSPAVATAPVAAAAPSAAASVPSAPTTLPATAPAPSATPPSSTATAPAPPPASPVPPTGRVMLDVKPWGEVLVDGRPRGLSPPLKVLQLPEGAHRIEVRNPAGAALVRDVKVTAGGRVEISHTFK